MASDIAHQQRPPTAHLRKPHQPTRLSTTTAPTTTRSTPTHTYPRTSRPPHALDSSESGVDSVEEEEERHLIHDYQSEQRRRKRRHHQQNDQDHHHQQQQEDIMREQQRERAKTRRTLYAGSDGQGNGHGNGHRDQRRRKDKKNTPGGAGHSTASAHLGGDGHGEEQGSAALGGEGMDDDGEEQPAAMADMDADGDGLLAVTDFAAAAAAAEAGNSSGGENGEDEEGTGGVGQLDGGVITWSNGETDDDEDDDEAIFSEDSELADESDAGVRRSLMNGSTTTAPPKTRSPAQKPSSTKVGNSSTSTTQIPPSIIIQVDGQEIHLGSDSFPSAPPSATLPFTATLSSAAADSAVPWFIEAPAGGSDSEGEDGDDLLDGLKFDDGVDDDDDDDDSLDEFDLDAEMDYGDDEDEGSATDDSDSDTSTDEEMDTSSASDQGLPFPRFSEIYTQDRDPDGGDTTEPLGSDDELLARWGVERDSDDPDMYGDDPAFESNLQRHEEDLIRAREAARAHKILLGGGGGGMRGGPIALTQVQQPSAAELNQVSSAAFAKSTDGTNVGSEQKSQSVSPTIVLGPQNGAVMSPATVNGAISSVDGLTTGGLSELEKHASAEMKRLMALLEMDFVGVTRVMADIGTDERGLLEMYEQNELDGDESWHRPAMEALGMVVEGMEGEGEGEGKKVKSPLIGTFETEYRSQVIELGKGTKSGFAPRRTQTTKKSRRRSASDSQVLLLNGDRRRSIYDSTSTSHALVLDGPTISISPALGPIASTSSSHPHGGLHPNPAVVNLTFDDFIVSHPNSNIASPNPATVLPSGNVNGVANGMVASTSSAAGSSSPQRGVVIPTFSHHTSSDGFPNPFSSPRLLPGHRSSPFKRPAHMPSSAVRGSSKKKRRAGQNDYPTLAAELTLHHQHRRGFPSASVPAMGGLFPGGTGLGIGMNASPILLPIRRSPPKSKSKGKGKSKGKKDQKGTKGKDRKGKGKRAMMEDEEQVEEEESEGRSRKKIKRIHSTDSAGTAISMGTGGGSGVWTTPGMMMMMANGGGSHSGSQTPSTSGSGSNSNSNVASASVSRSPSTTRRTNGVEA